VKLNCVNYQDEGAAHNSQNGFRFFLDRE